MSTRVFSTFGIVASALCLWLAAFLYPKGFDWNRDFISTLLRGPSGPSRWLADAGVLLFCFSMACLFERLARTAELAKSATVVRISGIGSQVYASLTITPMHDLMVTISFGFLFVAVIALTSNLYRLRAMTLVVVGWVTLAILVVSALVYYSGYLMSALPWIQRLWLILFAAWILWISFTFSPREQQRGAAQDTRYKTRDIAEDILK